MKIHWSHDISQIARERQKGVNEVIPMVTMRTESDDTQTDLIGIRTEIRDISTLGPELDEGQLVMVVGGKAKDGGFDSDPCPSGCH